ncbi:MAG: Homocitrate synthase [Solirubrobacterales bacterium]|jgi:isocitrate/isopropylmalate dehydrogenase|nr:Homocitrate synthase [Solirubrobacterales bacterium]
MGSAKRVAAIPGEDAAAEAFAATMSLLDSLSLDIDWTYPPVGAGVIQTHGEPFPAEAIAAIDDSDAALFGATSGASARALVYGAAAGDSRRAGVCAWRSADRRPGWRRVHR